MYHYRMTVTTQPDPKEIQAAYYDVGSTFVEFYDDNQSAVFAYVKDAIISIEKVNGN
jgi:hypothetical protein